MKARGRIKKAHPTANFSPAGQGGGRIAPPHRGPADEQKSLRKGRLFLQRRGRDSNPRPSLPRHSLSRRAHSATLAPPQYEILNPPRRTSCGGRGIRTHGELPHTCFQDRRLKPLGHPSGFRKFRVYYCIIHQPPGQAFSKRARRLRHLSHFRNDPPTMIDIPPKFTKITLYALPRIFYCI